MMRFRETLLPLCSGKQVRIIRPDAVPADGLVVDGSGMGAPTVSVEKLSGFEEEAAIAAVLKIAEKVGFQVFWLWV